ncbi:MAG: 23S rRNA (adenine(2503)-C(2))-methyltransferase RlmN [Phycisphaerales bacterium]
MSDSASVSQPAHRASDRPHVFGLTPDALTDVVTDLGMPRRVAGQILKWVYERGVVDPAAMTDLSKRDRATVAERLMFDAGRVIAHQRATDGTQKLLVDWAAPAGHDILLGTPNGHGEGDGNGNGNGNGNEHPGGAASAMADASAGPVDLGAHGSNAAPDADLALPMLGDATGDAAPAGSGRETECVMIPTDRRSTACISSQIGCPVGCRFCASGLGGLDGNLTAGRIVEQVHRLNRLPEVDRISNIVFMGMGEPLANFTAVTDAIRIINAPWGMGIGARRITVSTVGMPAAIQKLVDFEVPVTLALSLHAPDDDIRRQLIPWAEYASIDQLMQACDAYFQATGREITFEYLLLRGVNDRPTHARELARLARRIRANVNLIRWNEVAGLPYDRPSTEDVLRFQEILRENRVNTHIRASRGRDIAAACGQLRHEKTTERRAASPA